MAKELSLKDFLDSEKMPDLANLSFEKGMKILEELVGSIESGSFSLDKSVTAYERGTALMTFLKQQLEGAEKKLKTIQLPNNSSSK